MIKCPQYFKLKWRVSNGIILILIYINMYTQRIIQQEYTESRWGYLMPKS